jgi:hypothetical protein
VSGWTSRRNSVPEPGRKPLIREIIEREYLEPMIRRGERAPLYSAYWGQGCCQVGESVSAVAGSRAWRQPHRGARYPAEVIQDAVWLYHCFGLSLRDVEPIPAARGTMVTATRPFESGVCASVSSSQTH